jgi:hypothetical protein
MAKTSARVDGTPRRRKIALALQGGGAHGAFTWGVLDRMLEDETLDIIGVTGTSAGAMNTVALADGLLRGGPQQARRELREFWETIGKMPGFGSFLWPVSGESQANMRLEQTPAYLAWETVSRNLSPYDLNPFNINPLRAALSELIDFDVCARRRTCGSWCAQPTCSRRGGAPSSMRVTLPRTPGEIQDRMKEIGFNTAFWLELSAFAVILRFVDQGLLDPERFGRIRFHVIEAHDHLEKIAPSTKLNNSPAFLRFLFDLGRRTADEWFAGYREAIGQRSTIDLQKLLPVGA